MDLELKQAIELMVVILLVALLLVLTGNLTRKDSKQGKTEHSNLWSGARAVIPSKPRVIYEKAEEYTAQGENYEAKKWDGMGVEPDDITMFSNTLPAPYKKGDRYEISFEAKNYAEVDDFTVQFGEVAIRYYWAPIPAEEKQKLYEIYNKQVLSKIDDDSFDRVNRKTFSISNTWQSYSCIIEIGDTDGGRTDYTKKLTITYRQPIDKMERAGIRNVKITKIR